MDPLDIFNKVNNQSNPLAGRFNSFSDFLGLALNILMGVSIAISTIGIMVSGIQYVTSQGDPKSIQTAKNYLTFSIVGFILAVSAFTIKTVILNLIGVTSTEIKNEAPGF